MAIEYVSVSRALPPSAEMLATQTDITHLRSFSKADPSISAATAAAAVVRVVQDAASASGATQEAVLSAQMTLQHLCKSPDPNALQDLLVVCEYQVSFGIVDVFKLHSAAWKVVTATCLKVEDATLVPLSTRLRVLASALIGIRDMLQEVVHLSIQWRQQQHGNDPLSACTRYLKIARFHTINAARCCKAFLKFDDGQGASEEKWVCVIAQVLRLLACVSHGAFYNQDISETVRQDLVQNLCPALGGIMRSLLSMVCAHSPENSPERIIRKALEAAHVEHERLFLRAFAMHEDHVRILAVLFLLRLSASQSSTLPSKEGSRAQHQASDRCILLCRNAFCSSLLPLLFQSLDKVQVQLFSIRELQTGLSLFECVAAVAVQCMTANTMILTSVEQWQRVENFLFAEMNSPSALRAMLSHHMILALMDMLKNDEQARHRLLFVVLRATRLSFSLGTGYAELRWVPLAGALGFFMLKDNQKFSQVMRKYEKARGIVHRTDAELSDSAVLDPTILRFLSCMCGLMLSHGEDTKKDQSQVPSSRCEGYNPDPDSDILDIVFEAAGLNRKQTCDIMKRTVHEKSHGSTITEAVLYLLPYTVDGKSASEAVLPFLKRGIASIGTQIRAINILNPALLSSADIQKACTDAKALIESKGTVFCPSSAAFVARSSGLLHRDVSSCAWHHLSSLLELTVMACGKKGVVESCVNRLREAAVLFHGAQILRATYALSRNMPERTTRAVLSSCILRPIEDAEALLQELQRPGLNFQPALSLESQSRCTSIEQAECTRALRREDASRPGKSCFSVLEVLHSRLLMSSRKVFDYAQDTSSQLSEFEGFVDDLKDLVFVLESVRDGKSMTRSVIT